MKILRFGIFALALNLPIAALGQGSLVEGVLKHTNGYLTIYPYSATYNDGSFVKAYYDGNNKRILFLNSESGTVTGLYAGRIIATDNVGIGTTNPQAKLAVNGNILAKEVKVKTDITVPDYVFEPDYELPALADVEAYVKEHRHLPEIPSAADIARDGLDLAGMNLLLLKKVEELTLHIIQLKKSNDEALARNGSLEERIQRLENKE